jgi:NAD(P)-dependent dehydrogenase (short-subunit alcohol dehydrogenase family)
MDLGLRDRVCVVTGSTAGIGLATARMLAAEGARVVVTGRDSQRVEEAGLSGSSPTSVSPGPSRSWCARRQPRSATSTAS